MTRKASPWNLFVKKIYEEGKAKNKNYEFKQALVDASKRKSEMSHPASSGVRQKITSKKNGGKSKNRSRTMSRSMSASMSMAGGRRTRRHKKH
jgi:hypothetical protein